MKLCFFFLSGVTGEIGTAATPLAGASVDAHNHTGEIVVGVRGTTSGRGRGCNGEGVLRRPFGWRRWQQQQQSQWPVGNEDNWRFGERRD